MECIDGNFIMYGVEWNDPECIHTVDEAIAYIEEVGFLPLFQNEIPGFSLEERTAVDFWWSDDPERDPWVWRELIARSGKVAYGKFFDKKAGFISLKWLPVFANYRRDGYDFDALFDDGKAPMKHMKIMEHFMEGDEEGSFDGLEEVANSSKVRNEAANSFAEHNRTANSSEERKKSANSPAGPKPCEILSNELKQLAGFGKGGEKGFEGAITNLMMQLYLCNNDFRKRKNKKGLEYGWNVASYTTPEHLWGYETVTANYQEDPKVSWQKIVDHIHDIYPIATDKAIRKVLK